MPHGIHSIGLAEYEHGHTATSLTQITNERISRKRGKSNQQIGGVSTKAGDDLRKVDVMRGMKPQGGKLLAQRGGATGIRVCQQQASNGWH